MDHWIVLAVTCSLASVSASVTCPPGVAKLPHPSDCTAYYLCAYKFPHFMYCPAELEFSPIRRICEDVSVAQCTKQCDAIANDPQGTWNPSSCSVGPNTIGTTCSLKCNQGYQLRGSTSIICKDYGWDSTNGDAIPKCAEPICLSEDMKNAINDAMTECDGMLFVLDESGSIGNANFIKSKEFVNNIVKKFELSSSRTAGLITFDDYPIVHIPLTESSTANFQNRVNNVPYRGQGTKVLEALEGAIQEIQRSRLHGRFLVMLITDGISETDATPAANSLKNANHPVFTIGVGNVKLDYVESLSSMAKNGIRHFFFVGDYDVLKSISFYMNSSPDAAEEIRKKCTII